MRENPTIEFKRPLGFPLNGEDEAFLQKMQDAMVAWTDHVDRLRAYRVAGTTFCLVGFLFVLYGLTTEAMWPAKTVMILIMLIVSCTALHWWEKHTFKKTDEGIFLEEEAVIHVP